jgi:hypothetical protein
MAIKSRIEKIEQTAKPKKQAVFTIRHGRANGHALWREGLKWSNLTQREFEQLTADLAADGIQTIALNIILFEPNGCGIDGWGQVVEK